MYNKKYEFIQFLNNKKIHKFYVALCNLKKSNLYPTILHFINLLKKYHLDKKNYFFTLNIGRFYLACISSRYIYTIPLIGKHKERKRKRE